MTNSANIPMGHRAAHTLIGALGPQRHYVVSPGSRSTPLVQVLTTLSPENVSVVVDERVASFYALGKARSCGAAVVLICTSGSAAGHMLPAVMEAYYSRIPLFIVTADRPPELHYVGAPQTIEQQHLFGQYTRGSWDLGAPESVSALPWIDGIVQEAIAVAENLNPGPVHLNIGFREPLAFNHHDAPAQTQRHTTLPTKKTIAVNEAQKLWDFLQSHPKGALVVGPCFFSRAERTLWKTAIDTLATNLDWPVIAEPASQLRFAKGAATVSHADLFLRDENVAKVLTPSCVLRFGQTPTSKAVHQWLHSASHTILVHPHGDRGDPTSSANQLVIADPLALVEQLIDCGAKTQRSPEWLNTWINVDQQVDQQIHDELPQTGFWEGRIALDVIDSLPDQSAVHFASSMPIRDADAYTHSLSKNIEVFVSRGTNGIDGTIATALGEASETPHRPFVCVLGDLAFLHDVGGFLAMAQRTTPATLVLINNGGGGIFEFLPVAQNTQKFEEFFITPQKLNWPALAQVAGVSWTTVSESDAFRTALTKSFNQPGLKVIEANVDRSHNVQTHRELREKVMRNVRRMPIFEGGK